jgi:heme-degrading monooxygenase HmoA
MVARVTLAEVDAVRMSIDSALELYRTSVMPALRAQDGYEGCYVLTTPEGKALVVTFWSDEAAADAGLESGYYAQQVQKFVTLFRSPPGRETYDVGIADAPALAEQGGRS